MCEIEKGIQNQYQNMHVLGGALPKIAYRVAYCSFIKAYASSNFYLMSAMIEHAIAQYVEGHESEFIFFSFEGIVVFL